MLFGAAANLVPEMKKKHILIVSNPEDEHTSRVAEHLRKLGAAPILYYPENFGRSMFFALSQSLGDPERITVTTPDYEFSFDELDSIWYRRPRLVGCDGEELESTSLEFARDEWKAAFEATYALAQKPLWVSHPDNLREAARKPVQLKLAQQLGFSIPRTLISNNPNKVKEFYELCQGRVVVKATGAGWVYAQEGEDIFFVLTNRLSAEHIQASDEISLAPATYQEEIAKDYEIRINIVGQQALAVRIDSQSSEISKVDWRRYDVQNTPYSPYQLPAEIEKKCLRLAQLLGLEFGAVDLIKQPDGEYVFLEINGNGQFLWAEELSGVKISAALANLLAGIVPPLKFANL
jgi:glutathione synthase/RimK-type ligase-like ATP-grasp enzyme